MVLEVAQVFWIKNFRDTQDQLTKVKVVGCTSKVSKDSNKAHQLASNEIILAQTHDRKNQMDYHDFINNQDSHQ